MAGKPRNELGGCRARRVELEIVRGVLVDDDTQPAGEAHRSVTALSLSCLGDVRITTESDPRHMESGKRLSPVRDRLLVETNVVNDDVETFPGADGDGAVVGGVQPPTPLSDMDAVFRTVPARTSPRLRQRVHRWPTPERASSGSHRSPLTATIRPRQLAVR